MKSHPFAPGTIEAAKLRRQAGDIRSTTFFVDYVGHKA